ncbi:hypothetical protein BKA67DRAFT_686897 [Truncatella angustata]|uniref:Zn(2)-C6 fungal-type domain-containing protein n=1 Tax=Truncatella angustata TaxID=152316 RepID=A0A9P9A3U7_9PEZI|nr:uncharacterized protein BKA67DRAFT_686897 [Truncatella angustata]KAH6660513.1 hypothetical protein BKA67DRAFT_686897 [Truncatella angustata]
MPRKQTERKRRVHTRSRNGCVTCKAKHLRCDEQKPLCGRCLASGGSCGYVDRTNKHSHSPQPSSDGTITPKAEEFEFWDDGFACPPAPQNILDGYPGDASSDYGLLFDLFSRYRSVVDRDVSPDSHAFLVERALSCPALLHGAILLSALRWTWYSGSSENIQKSALHHKLEAIKVVNERLQHLALMATETTIAGVAALAMAESGFGRPDTARAHMHGLSQVLGTNALTLYPSNSLFYNMIICTTQGLSQMSMRQIFEITQSIEGCSTTLTLFIEPGIQTLSEDPLNWDATLGETILTSSYHERTDSVLPRSEAESRARFLQCCLRILTMLGAGNMDFFILNWFIEALIDELSMSEKSMLSGRFPRHAWFWAAMMVRVAVTSVRHCSTSEEQQINEWKTVTSSQIRLVADALGLQDWADVEALLRTWVWRDNNLDARELRGVWEEIVAAKKQNVEEGTLIPGFFEKIFCNPDEDRKPVIVDDEAFDLCVQHAWS